MLKPSLHIGIKQIRINSVFTYCFTLLYGYSIFTLQQCCFYSLVFWLSCHFPDFSTIYNFKIKPSILILYILGVDTMYAIGWTYRFYVSISPKTFFLRNMDTMALDLLIPVLPNLAFCLIIYMLVLSFENWRQRIKYNLQKLVICDAHFLCIKRGYFYIIY